MAVRTCGGKDAERDRKEIDADETTEPQPRAKLNVLVPPTAAEVTSIGPC